MTYNVLFTSLYQTGTGAPLRYYYAQKGNERMYANAMLTAEAPTKYLLSTVHIDEIIVMGRYMTFDEGDDEKTRSIADGSSFYHSDIHSLSTYSLFRYRLAQFRDDLNLEEEYCSTLIPEEDQKQIERIIQEFQETHSDGSENGKFNRFFDQLAVNSGLYDELIEELYEKIPGAKGRETAYKMWIDNYLYRNLREYNKLSILKENENVKIRFFPTDDMEDGMIPIERMMEYADIFNADSADKIGIYIAMNNDDMTDNFIMLGIMNILDMFNGDDANIEGVCTPTDATYRLSGMIRDNRDGYSLSYIITAVNTFLKYGKADMIADCWEKSGSQNEQVKKMVHAMKQIDVGLTVCSISNIVKGITSLRELFENGFDLSDCDANTRLFILMAEGIKKEYGKLVTSEGGFFDLIRWAYEKGFYQPCLTLIESKAPSDMVSRGILYYCNDESQKNHVLELFAKKRVQMKSYDLWKMNDIEHYFLKYYFYNKYPNNTLEHTRENAKNLVACIDNTNPDELTGYTVCDDRQLLVDLVFAYFNIGTIRNSTNHAETEREEASLFPDEMGLGSRYKEIIEGIQYFVERYEKVLENVKDKNPNVVTFTSWDVKKAAEKLEPGERDNFKKKD